MERSLSGASPRDDVHASGAAEPEQAPGGDNATWGCYTGGAAIDALLAFLNPVGLRENALRRVGPGFSLYFTSCWAGVGICAVRLENNRALFSLTKWCMSLFLFSSMLPLQMEQLQGLASIGRTGILSDIASQQGCYIWCVWKMCDIPWFLHCVIWHVLQALQRVRPTLAEPAPAPTKEAAAKSAEAEPKPEQQEAPAAPKDEEPVTKPSAAAAADQFLGTNQAAAAPEEAAKPLQVIAESAAQGIAPASEAQMPENTGALAQHS